MYATGVSAAKGQNTQTNATDDIFSDGDTYKLATLAGDTTNGYTATLTITISV